MNINKDFNTITSSDSVSGSQFWILCVSSILFMASFSMLLPELPEYLEGLGGKKYIGYIVGLFTLTAGLSRFLSGKLSDTIGRKKVIIFGTIVTTIAGGLYLVHASVMFFLFVRLFHGLSTGFRPTGSTALLTDIVPKNKRGEAMGYLGVAGSVGMAGGPAFGSIIKEEISMEALFITSSIIGLLALIGSLRLKESLPKPEKLNLAHVNPFKGSALTKDALPAAILILLETYAFGVIITLSPDLVGGLGLKYKGTFNLTFVLVSIIVRFVAGKASDRYRRTSMLLIGTLFMILSMVMMGSATSLLWVFIAGCIYGVSVGFNRPTIFAWTTDLAKEGQIGLALSTMLLGLEIGIGSGALISGYIYGGEWDRLQISFFVAAFLGVVSIVYLIWYRKSNPSL